MKTFKHFALPFLLFTLLTTSCNTTSNDPAEVYAKWKTQNENYLKSMNDSVGYAKDSFLYYTGKYVCYYYKITTPGNVDSGTPALTDTVRVNYRGKFVDGIVFDQTFSGVSPQNNSTSHPATFRANQLIYGWTLNLIKMNAGERRTVVLPQELCYGAYGQGAISPYSTLIFDIQLIGFGDPTI